jgi:hypothetical protein
MTARGIDDLEAAGRVPVQLRVGVTGHRWMSDDEATKLVIREALAELWGRRTNLLTQHVALVVGIIATIAWLWLLVYVVINENYL